MSHKINLGEGEFGQSLPSWISDHLGGKSYITDKANWSPSLLTKQTAHPEMDTSSLTKETNVMSQTDLDKLREKYSFPSRIQLKIPGEGETILSIREGEVTFYEAAFLAGLRLPIHPTIRRILNHFKICPAHLSPNAWRSVIYSLVIWRYHKHHMSCDEFRCLYSLSPLPDSGWYYFKARPEKNLLRGSPSNVKGWKKRFFFASGDEWEFFPSMPTSVGIPQVPQSWGTLGKSCNALPALTEVEAKRTAEVLGKIELGGYFDVSKVLGFRSFKKHFAVGCMEISTSGGDNITSGDEVVLARVSLSAPPQKAGEKAATDVGMKATPQPPLKGVVIQEKHPQESDYVTEKGSWALRRARRLCRHRFLKGSNPIGAINASMCSSAPGTSLPSTSGTSLPSGDDIGSGVSMMSSAMWLERYWARRYLLPTRRRPSSSPRRIWLPSLFTLWVRRLVKLSELVAKSSADSAKSEVVARLEAEVAELTRKLAQAKELAIEEFKSSEDFKVAITDSAATYFSKGFEFCKRQLLHQFPNLGVDVANMEMDAGFAEEEEEMVKEGEKEASNEGKVNPVP
ncbi:Glyceraldehyde-3-phosphate dehydrogenase, testis-specific like [Actinidia chinensis var. chinensis]|uniref:Glyceraldehyde-3-phosphate dehydrogenase, testis-specific like n=1 Tax=Actinidia chinensis var. chinensis TaxID=1590841 RepID=A0A2R6QF16_ACTCC|nr:Glyceraldehyde-3-phosphate dehydrogenase, testis-specific like [Actinidia chinensis var. chinensis]